MDCRRGSSTGIILCWTNVDKNSLLFGLSSAHLVTIQAVPGARSLPAKRCQRFIALFSSVRKPRRQLSFLWSAEDTKASWILIAIILPMRSGLDSGAGLRHEARRLVSATSTQSNIGLSAIQSHYRPPAGLFLE